MAPASPIRIHVTARGMNEVRSLTINEAATSIMGALGKSNDEANAMLEMIKHSEYAIYIPECQTHYQAFLTWPKKPD